MKNESISKQQCDQPEERERTTIEYIGNINKQLKKTIEKEKTIIESILNNLPHALYVFDLDNRILRWNKRVNKITGYSDDDISSMKLTDFFLKRDTKRLENAIMTVKKEGKAKIEAKAVTKDGVSIPLELIGTLLKDTGIIWIARDISDQKCTEKALRKSKKDYHQLLNEMLNKNKKAEEEKKQLYSQLIQAQKIEAIGRLAGGIAHDFNNLLTAILGYSDLAMIQTDNEDPLKKSINQIRFAAQRAAKLVHQLLIFSREEPMEFKPHNLSDIIENLLKMLKRIIGEDIAINFELDPEIWITKVDQGQIEQVIMNLAVNARDAMLNGGKLTIKTRNVHIDQEYAKSYSYARPGKFVCLSIEDKGIGMNGETIRYIFEPFFTTKKKGEGTGLGLSVVYGIVKEHKGWVNVNSEPGVGSTFNIYLPACFTVAVSEKKESIPFQNLQGHGERILFVEDDKEIREFMKIQLREKGYIVFTAENVKNTIDIFKQEKDNIDLLFTDVVLPDKRGIELVDILLSHNSNLKILLTSGYLDKKSEWPLIKERNFRFIKKPYTLVDLLHAIKESLNQST